jgi:hypothetical protein
MNFINSPEFQQLLSEIDQRREAGVKEENREAAIYLCCLAIVGLCTVGMFVAAYIVSMKLLFVSYWAMRFTVTLWKERRFHRA